VVVVYRGGAARWGSVLGVEKRSVVLAVLVPLLVFGGFLHLQLDFLACDGTPGTIIIFILRGEQKRNKKESETGQKRKSQSSQQGVLLGPPKHWGVTL